MPRTKRICPCNIYERKNVWLTKTAGIDSRNAPKRWPRSWNYLSVNYNEKSCTGRLIGVLAFGYKGLGQISGTAQSMFSNGQLFRNASHLRTHMERARNFLLIFVLHFKVHKSMVACLNVYVLIFTLIDRLVIINLLLSYWRTFLEVH